MGGSLAGGITGALGLGGGIAYNPVLLDLGFSPQVVSATSMYMIMFGALSSTLTFHWFKILPLDYAFWFGAWCALGIFLATVSLNKLISRSERPSFIVLTCALVTGSSICVMVVFNYIELADLHERGIDIWAWGDVCTA